MKYEQAKTPSHSNKCRKYGTFKNSHKLKMPKNLTLSGIFNHAEYFCEALPVGGTLDNVPPLIYNKGREHRALLGKR